MDALDTITALSHEFGSDDYVKGGGGNTSVKDETTLWVKPSGTTLAGMTRDSFVIMDRAAIGKLYGIASPQQWTEREALVKDVMAEAVKPGCDGRPSVEAPLHNSFDAKYVVHTHPALVNGLTCGAGGKEACAKMFPGSLWMDFIDPGYMLCMEVRKHIEIFKEETGSEPRMVFLKNHGVFIAGDTPEEIRALYKEIMDKLAAHYAEHNVDTTLEGDTDVPAEAATAAAEKVKAALGSDVSVKVGQNFTPVDGPLTPDHIVYAKAYIIDGEPTAEVVEAYRAKHGHDPRVFSFDGLVVTVGQSPKHADLAMTFAMDAALVAKLTAAFGGLEMMSQQALDFINNWEVESYRSKQI